MYKYINLKKILTYDLFKNAIGVKTFSNCTSLKQVSIPPSITSIGKNAFEGCPFQTLK